jgi:tRNA1Val (adenine37-N6)-methyltransferase
MRCPDVEPFRFKQFSVDHDQCAHRVGTDAVLVGSWADIGVANRILDIGTGSGVIALMLAQRTATHVTIDAIEPGDADRQQAETNIARSPWASRIHVYPDAVQHYAPGYDYDLIVSNPPFFSSGAGPPARQRHRARHTDALSFTALAHAAIRLLSRKGKLAVVLPVVEGRDFEALVRASGLYTHRRLAVFTRMQKPQERWLLEFSREALPLFTDSLVLQTGAQEWTAEYRQLTRDFYLGF